ncbi:hypothetical protein [Blastopirellula retiformator]|uniref:Carboxypeptidase regulatory-like domain-containing protein n=1 Tax=Blastopirellula retiformator TaxID=2527970 RepID=A0A5C5VLE1_9BACT|nr:hypothetical protein [Blastopirellula retiformator]TWT38760.1 hypothetical protein Enr8_04540 [Blastopirellula retiformator]
MKRSNFTGCLYLLTAVTLAIGCAAESKTHPVNGKVQLSDGTPVQRGIVEFRTIGEDGATINAHGKIEPDGTFQLTTFEELDGAVLGEHQVIVLNPATTDGGPVVRAPYPDRYRRYESSDLKVTVEPGPNDIVVELSRK